VGAMAGLHSLMVIALFRPGAGVNTWLALLVTGVVTVVMWALARPFRRLAAMVSLTRDQMSGFLPPAGTGALSRYLPGSTSRQDDWWTERRGTSGTGGDGWRPEGSTPARTEPATSGAGTDIVAPGPLRVDSERVGHTQEHAADPAAALAARRAAQRALPGGTSTGMSGGAPRGDRDATPAARAAVGDADRSLYRSVAARSNDAGGPRRPVQAEHVDGAPVYRVYRPSRPVGSGSSTRSSRTARTPRSPAGEGGARADPD
jgi:hypothetical protein